MDRAKCCGRMRASTPATSGLRPAAFRCCFRFRGGSAARNITFEGREYQLEPGDAFGNAIHGFVLNRPWRVVEQQAARVVGEFQASVDDPAILERWPADFRIRVSYEVRGPELVSEIRYENSGDWPAAVRVRDARLFSAAAGGWRQRGRHDCDGAGRSVLGA